jgi:glyoxylase-like metal-dependent hydrolase (beta-lactamase superfamily II)
MQEISHHIFIETGFPGVTLAVLRCQRGLVLIDAPLRIEDTRTWRSSLAGMPGGFERILISLDEHFDRTLGLRQMECLAIGHDSFTQVLRDRPVSFKTQGQETGAEWEMVNGLGVVRWAMPDITFTHTLDLYWDLYPIRIRKVAGVSACSSWVELPAQKILFIGDTVVPDAPPFLAAADLPDWQEAIKLLLSPAYKGYTLVSGRAGIISSDDVKEQGKFLGKLQQQVEKLAEKGNDQRDIEHASLQLLKHFDSRSPRYEHYFSRLFFGLTQYIKRHSS